MNRDEGQLLREKYHGISSPEYEADRKRLARGEPLAYVIGWQPFLGLSIYLDSRPLIPRVETEFWTEQLLREVKAVPRAFLDLCAGSGAIGCAALHALSTTQVYFGEIDPIHEQTIHKNICKNGLDDSRAHVRIGDLFTPFSGMQFDSIAVNPPYIPEDRLLPTSVSDFEPSSALRGGKDGLAVIRRIASVLAAHLAPGGEAWIECDSGHADATRTLFEAQGFHAEIRTDQYSVPRTLVVHAV